MASSPIQINLALNTSAVAKGAGDAERSLTDLEQAVESAGSGSRDVDKLERSMDDLGDTTRLTADDIDDFDNVLTMGTKKGERQLGDLERAMRDVQDETKRTAREARDIGDDGARGFRKLGDAGEEISGELRQNLGETFSSFRGDLEDLPQIAQDTLGGLAGSGALGGIPGLAATAAGAAGLGLIIGAFEKIGEANEREQERIQEWADAFISANGRAIEQSQINENIQSIQNDTEKLGRAQQIALLASLDLEDVIAGMADPFGAAGKALDEDVNEALDRFRERAGEAEESAGGLAAEQNAQLTALAQLEGSWRAHTDEVGAGAEAYDVFSGAAARARVANLEAAVAAGEAQKSVDQFGDSVYTLPDGKQVYVDAETGQATEDVNAIEQKIYSIPDGQSTVKVDVDSSAWDNWQPLWKRSSVIVGAPSSIARPFE